MKHYVQYMKRYYKTFIIAILFLLIETFCDLMLPTIMAKLVDLGVVKQDLNKVGYYAAMMLGITTIGAISATTRNIVSSHVAQNFGRDLRLDVYKKIQAFSFDDFNTFDRASLVTRLTSDVTQMQNFVNGTMRIFVKAPLICIGSIILASQLNIHLSVVLLVVVPIVILMILMNLKISYPLFAKVQKGFDRVNSVVGEYLSGVRVVKAFNRKTYEMERFETVNQDLGKTTTKAMRMTSLLNPSIALTVNLGIVAVLWIGGYGANTGSIAIGQVMAFINYMLQILFSLTMISMVLNMFVRAKTSATRLNEIFETEVMEEVRGDDATSIQTIEFENVSYTYKGSHNESVLKGISFTILKGQTVGIIGSTGSGKTTLVNLLVRLFDPTEGTIRINGVNANQLSPQSLREKMGIVPQRNVLFTGTIFDNIRWGNLFAPKDEVVSAAQIAEANTFIEGFSEGYETMVGQGGVNLSGGQKQRISIARALVRKPDVLILDDATSAVDVTTEGIIRERLKEYSKDLTMLIVAQQITTVMTADLILVLDQGELVGKGTHHMLLQDCNVYQEIYSSQLGKGASSYE